MHDLKSRSHPLQVCCSLKGDHMSNFPSGFPLGFTKAEEKQLFIQQGGDPRKWEEFKESTAYNRWKSQRIIVPGQFRKRGRAPSP